MMIPFALGWTSSPSSQGNEYFSFSHSGRSGYKRRSPRKQGVAKAIQLRFEQARRQFL